MNCEQAISAINAELAALDDDEVQTVADIVRGMTTESVLPRELTAEELALIEQSKEDFRQGRTYSLDEARAATDEFLATIGAPAARK